MGGAMSRNKGKVGERELVNFLKAAGFDCARGQQFKGTNESPDVVLHNIAGFHVECKRCERGSLEAWLAQATEDAGPGLVPMVAHRKNRGEWVAILRLADLIPLLQQHEKRERL